MNILPGVQITVPSGTSRFSEALGFWWSRSGDTAQQAGRIAPAGHAVVFKESPIYRIATDVAMLGTLSSALDKPSQCISYLALRQSKVPHGTHMIALLRDRVVGVADLVMLSRATLGNIWQNIALALGLKAVFSGHHAVWRDHLWMAILADTGATVLVTANALRLLAYRPSR